MSNWGATKTDWETLACLAPQDLWPTVNHPGIVVAKTRSEPGGYPTGGGWAKVPSQVTADNKAVRIPAWTRLESTARQRDVWQGNRDLGFGVVCRTIKAIDIDIEDEEAADEIDDAICDLLDITLPARRRSNSGSRVLLYRLEKEDRIRTKGVVVTPEGSVEFLFDRQFVALAGVHHSGQRQIYPDGAPAKLTDVPLIKVEQLDAIIKMLQDNYGSDTPEATATYGVEAMATERRAEDADAEAVESMVESLQRHGLMREVNPDGSISVLCPWQDQHASTQGQPDVDPSAVKLFPPGVGGFERWAFKCMHTSHGEKNFAQFAEFVGFVVNEFPLVDDIQDENLNRPNFEGVNRNGVVPATMANLVNAIDWEGTRIRLHWDDFQGQIMVAFSGDKNLHPFRDTDYVEMQLQLNMKVGIQTVTTQRLREAVHYVAERNVVDTAKDWIKSLRWDGVDRIKDFAVRVLGAADRHYSHAVVEYMWTALAARCLEPGIKADMVPVFIGPQGIYKSSAIQAMAPTPEAFLEVDLAARDDDLARMLRGRLVVEAGELRGFNSRDDNAIKSWITREEETWIPKYQEHFTTHKRRFLVIGSSNNPRFLQDPTGNRRWLPLMVGITRNKLDVEFIEKHIDQLWAQAKHMFLNSGIQYRMAELLAPVEHVKHVRLSTEELRVRQWLRNQDRDGWDTVDIMEGALGIGLANSRSTQASQRVEQAMVRSGYLQDDEGRWLIDFI